MEEHIFNSIEETRAYLNAQEGWKQEKEERKLEIERLLEELRAKRALERVANPGTFEIPKPKPDEELANRTIQADEIPFTAQDTRGNQDTRGVQGEGAEAEQPSISESAKDYINKGWSVIPIQKGTKQPSLSEWTPYQDKLPNPSELERWFKDTDHQIALVTGGVSGGLFILDFDGKQWSIAFEEFCRAFPEFEDTLIVETGSGKVHLYGRCPDMQRGLTKKVKKMFPDEVLSEGEKPTAIELRCNDHYTLCPPSIHPSGGVYRFLDEQKEPVEISLDRLNELVTWIDIKTSSRIASNSDSDNEQPDNSQEIELTSTQRRRLAKYYVIRLAGQCRGGAFRNDKGYELGRCLNNIGMPIEEAIDFVKEFHSQVPRVRDGDEYTLEEALKSIESAYGNPRSKPWIPAGFFQTDPKTGRYLEEGEVTDEMADRLLSQNTTEAGNAECFTAMYGGTLFCYIKEMKAWYWFDGVNWIEDDNEAKLKMLEVLRLKSNLANRKQDENSRKAIKQWCASCESNYKLESSLNIASSMMARKFGEFDIDIYTLACANGVIDLKGGRFRDALPGDFLLKNTWLEYNPEASCPRWLQFLDEIFDGNRNLVEYIQRAVGYSLTGSVKEDKFFLLWGSGSNGKTVFLEMVKKACGGYSLDIAFDVLEEHYKKGNEATPDIANLAGRRFVKSSETKEYSRFNTARLKYLTGGDTITARHLFKEPIEFPPTHKLWMSVNHKPRVEDDSEGMWRRVHTIPFTVRFVEPEKAKPGDRVVDRNLRDVLKGELNGILNWAIEGCLIWQREGLNPPPEVLLATEEYRKESDVIGRFQEDEIVEEDGCFEPTADIYKVYRRWCGQNNEKELNSSRLGVKLADRGFKRDKRGGVRGFVGLRLIKPVRDEESCETALKVYRASKSSE